MAKTGQYPSYTDCVARALSCSKTPLMMDQLLAEVSAQRPITKSVRSAIYQAVDRLYQAVQVGQGQFGWISHLLTANVVRHMLTATELRRGCMVVDELQHIFLSPEFFQTQRTETRKVSLELNGGPTLLGTLAFERDHYSLLLGPEFVSWVDRVGGQAGDDIHIRVLDANEGRYSLRLQPQELRQTDGLRDRDLQVAKLAEEIVSEDRKIRYAVPVWELAARMIGQGAFRDPVPPSNLHDVLRQHSPLRRWGGEGYTLPHRLTSVVADLAPIIGEELEDWFATEGYLEDTDLGTEEWFHSELDGLWELEEAEAADDSLPCSAYEEYLEEFETSNLETPPLSHEEYHLLEAELENMINLEYEFGYLLPDQQARKQHLAERLFIDPDSLLDDDMDDHDFDGPPFWQN